MLQAHLERGTDVRSPVKYDDLSDIDNAALRAASTVLRGVDRIVDLTEGQRGQPPYRYCWPPVG